MFLTYCFFSASWLVGSILTNDMIQEFGITAVPSSVNNAISAAKILGNFVAAWILIKLGPKKAVTFSAVLICCVVFGALSSNLPFFVITRFLLGFGGAVLMICMTPYVVYCFKPARQPIFIGLNNAGPNTGNLIALLSITPVRMWLGSWRYVILFYACFSVVLLILWIAIGKGYPITRSGEQSPDDPTEVASYRYRDGLREPFLYRFLLAMTGRLVVYTVMLYLFPLNPAFTVDAQFISLMIAITGIPGTIVGILLANRLERKAPLFKGCGIAFSAVFFVMILTPIPAMATVCAVLLGAIIFVSTPALFTLPAKLPGTTPRKVAVIMTLYWTLAYLIQMAVYAFIVWLVNRYGWHTAMVITALYSITSLVGSFFLPDFRKGE